MQAGLEVRIDDFTQSQQQGQLLFLNDEQRRAADQCQDGDNDNRQHAFSGIH